MATAVQEAILSLSQFIRLVLARKGTTIVSFTAITDAKLRKNPFGKVVKASYVNGIIGYNYEHSVNLQREREGSEADFLAAPRQWGRRIFRLGKATPFVAHKPKGSDRTKIYLTVKVERAVAKPRYFTLDGKEIPVADLIPFMPAQGPTRQDLDKEVIHREYSLDNLTSLVIGGVHYQLVSD